MKMNAGILTDKIEESKAFYSKVLGFGVSFENEFYLLMHTPDKHAEIGFLLPEHPSQHPFFHAPFEGRGIYLTIEVEDVERMHDQIQSMGVEIKVSLRTEPWGDRHFSIEDPNGVGIDIVTYTPPETL